MVKHIVMWQLKEDINAEDAASVIKVRLEGLVGIVPGLVSAEVGFDCNNRTLVLTSLLQTPQALAQYQTHPAHLEVVAYVKAAVCSRTCCDYMV
ncbi:MAG: Dabb family protein [Oscillospiraceae bacterium]|nr:Dabb family protein [Oscillospiraceae bacterium]